MASFLKIIDEGVRALVYAKFSSVMSFTDINAHVLLFPPEIAVRQVAEKRNETSLEFANVWRSGVERDLARASTSIARRGLHLVYSNSDENSSGETELNTGIDSVYAVPVKLTYNVWFWSLSAEILNQVDELYLFWKYSDPNLYLNYNDAYPLELDLMFGDVEDESEISSMYNIGKYFVHRVPIIVEGWVFSSFDIKTVKKIVITVWDRDDVESISEFIEDPDETLKFFEKEIVLEAEE